MPFNSFSITLQLSFGEFCSFPDSIAGKVSLSAQVEEAVGDIIYFDGEKNFSREQSSWDDPCTKFGLTVVLVHMSNLKDSVAN